MAPRVARVQCLSTGRCHTKAIVVPWVTRGRQECNLVRKTQDSVLDANDPSSTVIGKVQEWKTQTDIALLFHYFDYHTPNEQDADLICASFLKQTVQQILKRPDTTIPSEIESLYNDFSSQNRTPTQRDLLPIIEALLESFTTTYIIIDALDECFEDYRYDVMSMLLAIAGYQQIQVHILVTSRPHIEDIRSRIPQWPHIEIQAHQEDIRRLFYHKLERSQSSQRIITANFKEEIITAIATQAQGM
jgi:hypothetical protein